jgi:acetylglutamate synthase
MGVPSWSGHEDKRVIVSPFTDARPMVDHTRLRHLLGPRRQRTLRAVVYLERIAKKLRRWEVLNDTYAYIVATCEGQ